MIILILSCQLKKFCGKLDPDILYSLEDEFSGWIQKLFGKITSTTFLKNSGLQCVKVYPKDL